MAANMARRRFFKFRSQRSKRSGTAPNMSLISYSGRILSTQNVLLFLFMQFMISLIKTVNGRYPLLPNSQGGCAYVQALHNNLLESNDRLHADSGLADWQHMAIFLCRMAGIRGSGSALC